MFQCLLDYSLSVMQGDLILLTLPLQDVDMQRGKPLYLNEERYAALTYMVTILLLFSQMIKYFFNSLFSS